MSEPSNTAPYGFWDGLFDVKSLFENPPTPMYPCQHQGRVYWLEARPAEGGRVVLMQRLDAGAERCLTPDGYAIRSRVHEYGGCPYVVHGDSCFFVNDQDQRIYRQALDGEARPVPVTPDSDPAQQRRYIDLCAMPDGSHLVCVVETEVPASENENALACVPLEAGAVHSPRFLHRGHDFYANPALDPVRPRVAWIQWDHPCMPWDQCQVAVAPYERGPDGALRLGEPVYAVNEPDTSACQLAFDQAGDLFLAIDGASAPGEPRNFWNLYRWRDGLFLQLTHDDKEYGAPHWVFGDRRYVVTGDRILAVRTGPEGDELVSVDKQGGGVQPVETDSVDIRQLAPAADGALLVTAARDRSPGLARWQPQGLAIIKRAAELLPPEAVSHPRALRFPTGGNDSAHAYFYPPCNPRYAGPGDEAPPVLVMVHGGPTGRCSNALDLTRQYWTGIGFAVLDVNYRGSTGYGRAYRQSLLGEWGRYDTEDVVKAVAFAADRGWVDPRGVFIRGRSAGGYAVLSALTRYPQVFAAGACYYGIGNLVTLAQITHKFEGRYTDRLIGEDYEPARAEAASSRFRERSPIHHVAEIRCPLIVFQGLEDRIVPPAVSREIAQALAAQGLDYEYVEYPGEGHGFRSSETNIDALERETGFYRKVLRGGGDASPGGA